MTVLEEAVIVLAGAHQSDPKGAYEWYMPKATAESLSKQLGGWPETLLGCKVWLDDSLGGLVLVKLKEKP